MVHSRTNSATGSALAAILSLAMHGCGHADPAQVAGGASENLDVAPAIVDTRIALTDEDETELDATDRAETALDRLSARQAVLTRIMARHGWWTDDPEHGAEVQAIEDEIMNRMSDADRRDIESDLIRAGESYRPTPGDLAADEMSRESAATAARLTTGGAP